MHDLCYYADQLVLNVYDLLFCRFPASFWAFSLLALVQSSPLTALSRQWDYQLFSNGTLKGQRTICVFAQTISVSIDLRQCRIWRYLASNNCEPKLGGILANEASRRSIRRMKCPKQLDFSFTVNHNLPDSPFLLTCAWLNDSGLSSNTVSWVFRAPFQSRIFLSLLFIKRTSVGDASFTFYVLEARSCVSSLAPSNFLGWPTAASESPNFCPK